MQAIMYADIKQTKVREEPSRAPSLMDRVFAIQAFKQEVKGSTPTGGGGGGGGAAHV